MNKNIKKMLIAALLAAIIAFSSGCSKQRDYGENFNLETDCQYSYADSFTDWKKVQSDGNGQYILKNKFIYYYNTEKKTLAPLCNKANCLHDMETDKDKLIDCNAYIPETNKEYIQYYDGYVYYISSFDNALYRVSKDGSKKDKIFKTDMMVHNWLIHRGYLYYELQTHYYGEDKSTNVYSKSILKSVELSSNMSEKESDVIFESDEEHSAFGIYKLTAYKNYLCYELMANEKDFEMTTQESWFAQLYSPHYLYNIDTRENKVIPTPKCNISPRCHLSSVIFLEDKMLLRLYDDFQGTEYKLPIYSINYDLTEQKIWLDGVEQGKFEQTYDDYVIISDAQLHYDTIVTEEGTYMDVLKDDKPCINVEIYSSDAKRVSYFVYPMNVNGNFNGFGPDGVNVEFDEDDNSWSVYELNFKDVLNCRGEEVKLDRVNTRRFGPLNGVN